MTSSGSFGSWRTELPGAAGVNGWRIGPPIKLDVTRAGPGHYLVSGATFGVKGDWHLEVVARVSEFDELRKTLVIPIR